MGIILCRSAWGFWSEDLIYRAREPNRVSVDHWEPVISIPVNNAIYQRSSTLKFHWSDDRKIRFLPLRLFHVSWGGIKVTTLHKRATLPKPECHRRILKFLLERNTVECSLTVSSSLPPLVRTSLYAMQDSTFSQLAAGWMAVFSITLHRTG